MAPDGQVARVTFPAVGTEVLLEVVAPDPKRVVAACRDVILHLEARLSRFRLDSDVSRLNRVLGEWVEVGPHTAAVLEAAASAWAATGGLFDATAGGGFCGLTTDGTGRWRVRTGFAVDLGGIAKGYIADKVRDVARAAGATSALVSLGSSSVAVLGERPGGGPWRVGLRAPGHDREAAYGVVELAPGASLSTSGLDEAPGHLVDPRTGLEVRGEGAQALAVTVVVGPDVPGAGMVAEAWSTALMIGGPEALTRHYARQAPAPWEAVMVTGAAVMVTPLLAKGHFSGTKGQFRQLVIPALSRSLSVCAGQRLEIPGQARDDQKVG
ncbi:MAG: FAD:protein FMN transferase [Bifidobacteriaceae bacterium]|jgi:thiamine biosynthesis lipoprotein|nr:FAD:protein FMN transferase [Bifidobacteriaceae bacterium]